MGKEEISFWKRTAGLLKAISRKISEKELQTMKSIREDYRARAASFENDEIWKRYLKEKIRWCDDSEADPDEAEYYEHGKEMTIRNCYLIRYFADDLAGINHLGENTIQTHVDNMDFYLNYYAVDRAKNAEQAVDEELFDDYMEEWFPRKAGWCSLTSMKSTCASMKKFCIWLKNNSLISQKHLETIENFIKQNRNRWLSDYQKRCF